MEILSYSQRSAYRVNEPTTQTMSPATDQAWLDRIAWDERGLVPAIAQAADTRCVLTLAWMNREALAATVESGYATYWSRSRAKLWRKGESSGHRQRLIALHLDCDNDALLLEVEQIGGAACHTGRESCFFRSYEQCDWVTRAPVLVDPRRMYANSD